MATARVEYLSFMVNCNKFGAMWPKWRDGRLFSIWYYATNRTTIFLTTVTTLTLALKIANSFEDIDGIATVIDFATVYASGVFRLIYVTSRGAAYQRLINSMNDGFTYESFNPFGDKLTMKPSQILAQRIAVVYYFGSAIFILQMVIGPIVISMTNPDSQIPLIFEGWHPFDETVEPVHSIVFIVQAVSWLLMGYHYLLMDTFWYMIIVLIIGQLQIIAHTYNNLVPQTTDEDIDKPIPPYANDIILKGIKQHQLVRRFIADVESLLSPIIIVDFVHALFSITFLLLDITIALTKGDWLKIMHLVEYLNVSILHMFAYNWLGNELALQEDKLAEATYGIPWYRSPKMVATEIMFTSAASRKPIRLTGGKFYNLTLEFFVMAIRSIFSYFMVLFQLRYEDPLI